MRDIIMISITKITGSRIVINPVITNHTSTGRAEALDITIDFERRSTGIVKSLKLNTLIVMTIMQIHAFLDGEA